MKHLMSIFLLILLSEVAFSQIFINEVSSRNANVVEDEDGDFEDWIELYNNSASTLDLQGYYISDDIDSLDKWQFPPVTFAPASYLTMFASDKNRLETIDHWETAVYAEGTWRYLVPVSPVPVDWNTQLFDDSGWLTGIGGFGYGDGDDNTIISPPVSSFFIRQTFNIVDTAALSTVIFHMDYDDGFIAYINGVEIARSNIGVTGTPAPYDELAYDEHEAAFYRGEMPQEWVFPEQNAKTVLVNGTNVLSIQVHNLSYTSSDMTAIPYLSFAIKDNSANYGTPPFWFKKGASRLHTNFKLSSNGETIYLSDPSLQLIDSLAFPELGLDDSYGRFPDANINMSYFGKPTPDSTNNTSTASTGYMTEPGFSYDAGYYDVGLSLSLTSIDPLSIIRYTLDGSPPNVTSQIYINPIPVDSTMVIRAVTFKNGLLPSEIVSNSYFIGHSTTLPIFSISTHPDNFWDWETGIYMAGPNAEPNVPYFNANFWQDWEIPVHIEYFDQSGVQQFEQDFGAKIHGGWSRSNDLKSLRILAKGKYGKSSLDYQLFPEKEIYSFKRFVLRNSGNETNVTHFRDALMHKAVHKNTHIDIQDYKPSVVFINGDFLGVLNMREKISIDYLAENYGVDPDSVDLLQFDGYVIDGTNEHFLSMAEFIVYNDMADTNNYNSVETMLDIENFCDYFIAQTYYVNWDWPQNNVKYWRERSPGARWRYIMTDVDMGLGLFGSSFTGNDLNRVINAENNYHSFIFKSLLNNLEFRDYFINRYADLINTIFLPDNLKNLAYSLRDSIAAEMPMQFEKWGGSMEEWQNWNIDNVLINFIENRAAPARDYIEQEFELSKQVAVTIDVYPPEAGQIKISTITPDEYPWSGIYFDGVPVRITAIANPGFEFSFWQSLYHVQSPDTNMAITLNLDTNDVFTAYFYGEPAQGEIVISEINYRSATTMDAGDWIELYNYGNAALDLSGWTFKDSNDVNSWIFPQYTLLDSDEYLVLYKDNLLFTQVFPQVDNATGPFGFGLSSTGEMLRLYDANGDLKYSMTYQSIDPWPLLANGGGPTLELVDIYDDPNDASNWFAGCKGGSPGTGFVPCNMSIDELYADNDEVLIFPNPFSNQTNLVFNLHSAQDVIITIVDQQGRIVSNKTITGNEGENTHTITAGNLATGMYYCRLVGRDLVQTKVIQIINQ